jgi:hypothetical protein
VKVGDTLKVTAAPSLTAKDPYLSAITIANAVTGASITLRDATGIPLWTSAGSRRGTPPGLGTHANYGFAAIVTVTGTVDQVTAGVGIQMPALVLKTADGKLLTLKIGPERVLAAADFEIKPGEVLTVRYAACATGELLALELTNASGVTLVLRNDDGTPAWN